MRGLALTVGFGGRAARAVAA